MDSNNNSRNDSRPSVEWERAVWSFTEGNYTVQADRLPLAKPRFSVSIGVHRDGAGPSNFTTRIGAFYRYVDGEVHFDTLPPPGLIDRLLQQAKTWIESEVQASEARYQQRQQRRQKPAAGAHERDSRQSRRQ